MTHGRYTKIVVDGCAVAITDPERGRRLFRERLPIRFRHGEDVTDAKATPLQAGRRRKICRDCPEYDAEARRCRLIRGCYSCSLKHAGRCPQNHW